MSDTDIAPQYTHLYYEYWACWDGCWAMSSASSTARPPIS